LKDDHILEMAKQAMHSAGIKPNDELRFYVSYNNGIDDDGFCARAHSFIEDFARLIEASVREECAALCDKEYEAGDCAAAIRGMK
jgi:hypothetical protein